MTKLPESAGIQTHVLTKKRISEFSDVKPFDNREFVLELTDSPTYDFITQILLYFVTICEFYELAEEEY